MTDQIKEMSGKEAKDVEQEDATRAEDDTGMTSEQIEQEMEEGEKEEDVYSEEGREKLVEDDEIEPAEEGFMEGAEEKGEMAKCENCGKILDTDDKSSIVERELDGEKHWFCSEKCAMGGEQPGAD
ncbi:hypothetical protein GF351_00635 [Candidatus Woesearchaeota archaeon]|nr:hypothetical protein [Candidatus Woesearchaeota archaeon]